jgi:hypothetical protein
MRAELAATAEAAAITGAMRGIMGQWLIVSIRRGRLERGLDRA